MWRLILAAWLFLASGFALAEVAVPTLQARINRLKPANFPLASAKSVRSTTDQFVAFAF